MLITNMVVSADGSTIEDFETGDGWPWSPWQGGSGTVSSSYAHDGTYGICDPGWCYRTDVSIGNADDTLSAWVRFETDGRFYLGFAADSEGCWSFVVAPNTNNIIIQQNSGYGYSNKVTTTYSSFTTNVWYKAVVEFASTSSVTGKLYSSDGNTLLAQVSYNSVTDLPGGVSMRSFGTTHIDTIESNAGASNSAPTANSESFSPDEDTTFSDSVSGSDSDGSITEYQVGTQPDHDEYFNFNTNNGAFSYRSTDNWYGTDTFTFRVKDDDNEWSDYATITLNVQAVNDDPVANFSVGTIYQNEEATFNATNSTDIDGTITNYSWDWTNDGAYDNYSQIQNYTYQESGTYTVKLRVTDNNGATGVTTQEITVYSSPSPPVPEVSTFILFGLGTLLFIGMITIKRRKK